MANFKTYFLLPLLLFAFSCSAWQVPGGNAQGQSKSKSSQASQQKLNINTATFEQLVAIKGIGPAKAKAILDYIKDNGALVSLDELMEIKGIGKALLRKIAPQVRI